MSKSIQSNMSRFLFAFILCCCITSLYSQGKEVSLSPAAPDPVLKGFIKNYGNEKTYNNDENDDGINRTGISKMYGVGTTPTRL